jgi:pimeloyl-ACP methyl ester carboxylesterase
MPAFEVNHYQMHYEVTGVPGPPVIFLHGLGSSAGDWALQVPAFAARHRVITVDLRGHGQSRFRGRLAVPEMAEDVAQLLRQLGGPAHVVGLSMGGCAALALGILHPELTRSLTLVNTFARYQPPGDGGLGRVARRLWLLLTAPMPRVAAFIAEGLFPKAEQRPLVEAAIASLGQNPKRTYWEAIQAIRRFDARAGLSTIRCPVLVVIGDRDQTVPRAAGEALAAGIPGARQLVLADSGHASPMDQPEAFNAKVLEFIEASDGNDQ